MNREQKAVVIVATILILVIMSLVSSTYYLWKKSRTVSFEVSESTRGLEGESWSFSRSSKPDSRLQLMASTQVKLYYFDPERDQLVPQAVYLPLQQRPENLPELIQMAWERLEGMPTLPSKVSPLPEGTPSRRGR